MLRPREHFRKDHLEKEKTETCKQNLTFNITDYSVFQNIRAFLQEIHLLLETGKKQKKVFPNVPAVGFPNGNGKSLKYYRVRAALPKTKETRKCDPFEKKLVQFVTQ